MTMSETRKSWTPGPWDYVPSTEHHGPYVTTEFGSTVADCYCMSDPSALSICNGGTSKPIHHMAEMADANARLIAAAPDMYEALDDWRSTPGNHRNHAWWQQWEAKVEAALAKANGGPSND